jgi:hypothetical protein
MKNLALLAATGSIFATALPVQAASFVPAPAPIAVGYTATAMHDEPAGYDRRRHDDRRWRDDRGRYDYGYDDRRYDDRRYDRPGDYWRDNDGRWRCRRADGTVGLVIGAGVGALIGRQVDQRGDRTLGTILGAVGGGLLGREIDRNGARCR